MKKLLVLFSLMVFFQSILITGVSASEVVIRDDFGKHFHGFTGTFAMYDPSQDMYTIYNQEQAQKRLSPCSTFKIFNSLIGLETGVLDSEDVYTLIKWDGKEHDFPNWNRDHTLASATQESVVWYFQELAARIGQERMQDYLSKIGYGNQDISGGLTTFWLRSSLKISALEQVDLLTKLYNSQLPFSANARSTVLKNITLSDTNGVKLLGKTGSGLQDGKWILGWFVGYIENQGKLYVVATNIEGPDGAFGGKAREITKAIAKDLNLL